ncbi:type III pantothenate kinase [Sinomicrobium sp.]
MTIAVDAGNTFVKVAVFRADTVVMYERFENEHFLEKISNLLNLYPEITDMMVASVSDLDEDSLRTLDTKVKIHVLDSHFTLPFENLYATPKTLGADRLALVAAASRAYPGQNVLVIDSGTCITYDFLDAQNRYLGGAISPGIRMRYHALHAFTARLPLLDIVEIDDFIGDSTSSAMTSGVLNGLVNEIDGVIGQYRERFQNLTVILTGGDLDFLSEQLKSSIFANPNFLLEGLNYILELNKNP